MGRRAVPTNLKIIQGTDQKCRINKDEPMPELVIPDPPQYLCGDALDEWRKKSVYLYNNGCMTALDDTVLAAYCVVWARHVEAEKEINKNGSVVITSNGNEIQSPWVGISNRAQDLMIKYASVLGLGAANRSKIRAEKKPIKEKSKWAKQTT